MTGKDLFEGLSFIDECFIEEAENASLVRAPWLRIASIAACLCLVLFSLWCIHPTQIEVQILPGSYVLVVCDEYDPDTGIIIARFISPAAPQ